MRDETVGMSEITQTRKVQCEDKAAEGRLQRGADGESTAESSKNQEGDGGAAEAKESRQKEVVRTGK